MREFKLLHKQMATFSFPLPFLSMEHHCLQVTNPEICLLTELIAKAAYAVWAVLKSDIFLSLMRMLKTYFSCEQFQALCQ